MNSGNVEMNIYSTVGCLQVVYINAISEPHHDQRVSEVCGLTEKCPFVVWRVMSEP